MRELVEKQAVLALEAYLENDRIAQFRILYRQPHCDLIKVKHLEGENRGGFGSTGTR